MAEPYNRLAQFSAPVADDQVNMLAPQLPAGHPSNMLMWIRDQIPQVQADDSSLASGIYSRLGRTATAIPRAGLETAANWLRGVNDPNAVRIGEDTIAPLGLFGMAGLAARAPRAAATAARSDAAIARDLAARYPEEIAGGSMSRQAIAGGPRVGVVSDEGMTPMTLTRDAMHRPGEAVSRAPAGLGRAANDLMADNAKSSVPGTVVNAFGDRSLTELTDTPPRFRPDRAVAATENNPYVTVQGGRDPMGYLGPMKNYFSLDENGRPIAYAQTTMHPIGIKIEGVEVAKGHRGKGVANDLYDTIEQSTGLPVRPSGVLSDDGLRLWQGRDPEAVKWHQPFREGFHYSPKELKSVIDTYGHGEARRLFDALPPEARTPERLSMMFADNAKSSVPGTAANATQEDSPVLDILSKYGLY